MNKAFFGNYMSKGYNDLRNPGYNKQIVKPFVGWYEAPMKKEEFYKRKVIVKDVSERRKVIKKKRNISDIDIHQNNNVFLSLPIDIFSHIFEYLDSLEVIFSFPRICLLMDIVIKKKQCIRNLILHPNSIIGQYKSIEGGFVNEVTDELFLHIMEKQGLGLKSISLSFTKLFTHNTFTSAWFTHEVIDGIALNRKINVARIISQFSPRVSTLHLHHCEVNVVDMSSLKFLKDLVLRSCHLVNNGTVFIEEIKSEKVSFINIIDKCVGRGEELFINCLDFEVVNVEFITSSFSISERCKRMCVKTEGNDLSVLSYQRKNLEVMEISLVWKGIPNNWFAVNKFPKLKKLQICEVLKNSLKTSGLFSKVWKSVRCLEISLRKVLLDSLLKSFPNLTELKLQRKLKGSSYLVSEEEMYSHVEMTKILESLPHLEVLIFPYFSDVYGENVINVKKMFEVVFLLAKKKLRKVEFGYYYRLYKNNAYLKNEWVMLFKKHDLLARRLFGNKVCDNVKKLGFLINEYHSKYTCGRSRDFKYFSIPTKEFKNNVMSKYKNNTLMKEKIELCCTNCNKEVVIEQKVKDDLFGYGVIHCTSCEKKNKKFRTIEHLNYLTICEVCGLSIPVLEMNKHVNDYHNFKKKNLEVISRVELKEEMEKLLPLKRKIWKSPWRSCDLKSYCMQCNKVLNSYRCDCNSKKHKGRPTDGIDYEVVCFFCRKAMWLSEYKTHLKTHIVEVFPYTHEGGFVCSLKCGFYVLKTKNAFGKKINHVSKCKKNDIYCHGCDQTMNIVQFSSHKCKKIVRNIFVFEEKMSKLTTNKFLSDVVRRKVFYLYELTVKNDCFGTKSGNKKIFTTCVNKSSGNLKVEFENSKKTVIVSCTTK